MIEAEGDEIARTSGAFENFSLSEETKKNLRDRGIEYLFPVQVSTFKLIVRGYNVIVRSRTGTGKTLGFLLPIVETLRSSTRSPNWPLCLVMAPTRELAKQTFDTVRWLYPELRAMCLYGGASNVYMQAQQIRKSKPTMIVGTPGRIKDHLEKKVFTFDYLKCVVLDECDRMLDMGFKDDVETILNYAPYFSTDKESLIRPQTLIFSATVPKWVHDAAVKYCEGAKAKIIDLVGDDSLQTSTCVDHYAIKCEFSEREETIANILRCYCGLHRQAIVFCDTKKEADALSTSNLVHLDCHVLNFNDYRLMLSSLNKTNDNQRNTREGKYRVLVTTDVAARGLDIPNVDLVVVTAPPIDSDQYVHRSGRTGRAGRKGRCICLYKSRQRNELQNLEVHTNIRFKRVPAPTSSDLMKARVRDAFQSLASITADVQESFMESADEILAKMSPREALASALAVISSSENVDTNASLLSGRSGFTSYHLNTTLAFQSCSVIIFFLRRAFGETVDFDPRKDIGKILFTDDKLNAFFEVSNRLVPHITSSWHDSRSLKLSIACELPKELVTPDELFGESMNEPRTNGHGRRPTLKRSGDFRNKKRWSGNGRQKNKRVRMY
ncbi:hypothetical protein ACOME3_008765 [Neoechinorhynchus agilis]